jgi:hypothetical protein
LDQHRPVNVAEIARDIHNEMIQSGNPKCQPDNFTNRILNRLTKSQPVWATNFPFPSSSPKEDDTGNDSSFQMDDTFKKTDDDSHKGNEKYSDLGNNIRVTFS